MVDPVQVLILGSPKWTRRYALTIHKFLRALKTTSPRATIWVPKMSGVANIAKYYAEQLGFPTRVVNIEQLPKILDQFTPSDKVVGFSSNLYPLGAWLGTLRAASAKNLLAFTLHF